MSTDHIRYDILAQEALRGMVRTVLIDAAKKGLPGEHHFFISFDTRADGVRLSTRLREQYPEEMTVVMQHQFWDLKVSESEFEVGLSFNGVAERLAVPFAAIKSFVDPSAQFALQFEEILQVEDNANVPPAKPKSENKNEKTAGKPRRQPRQEGTRTVAARTVPSIPQQPAPAPAGAAPSKPALPSPTSNDKPDKPSSGGEVVRLDRFRKK